jgi:hypothetical protein
MCVFKYHAFIFLIRPPRWQRETLIINRFYCFIFHQFYRIFVKNFFLFLIYSIDKWSYSRCDIIRRLPLKSTIFWTAVSQQPGNILTIPYFNESILGTNVTFKKSSNYIGGFFQPLRVKVGAFFVADYLPFFANKIMKTNKNKQLFEKPSQKGFSYRMM